MRAIVTGGAGFVGSHVVDALLARGDEVSALDNLATGSRENVAEGAKLVVADVREPLDSVFDELRPQVCFHLAAQADVVTSVERPDYDAEVNVLGTVHVLEAARRHGAAVVFSSTGGAIYGECERPAQEDDSLRPLSPYGTAKLAGEAYLATWGRLHGMRNASLRLGNVYGPRQLPSLEGGVVAIFLDRMRKGEPTQIFGDGHQTRDFVFVGDVAQALLAAAGREGVFNVGTGVETSIVDLHAVCRRVTGSELEPEHVPARPGELQRSVLDPALAVRELGWQAEHALEDGLRTTWEWPPA
ncbi:MAG: NAD-dependent epimerase/dehydratase family protein, partial [Gaiellaceae bacterium]